MDKETTRSELCLLLSLLELVFHLRIARPPLISFESSSIHSHLLERILGPKIDTRTPGSPGGSGHELHERFSEVQDAYSMPEREPYED